MKKIIGALFFLLLATVSVPWQVFANDCPEPNATGSATISSSCSFAPTVEGIENGNLIIQPGVTFNVKAGQTVTFKGGSVIIKPGATITVFGTIKNTDVCMTDQNHNGYPANASHDSQTAGPCTGNQVPRSTLIQVGGQPVTDCDDTAPGSGGISVLCYPDADLDGVFSPHAVNRCQAFCTGPNWSTTPGTDCNDGNSNVWIPHAQCYADLDKDGYTNGLASNTTCLNTNSCSTATYASSSVDGAAVSSYTAGQLKDSPSANNDCCDTDNKAYPNEPTYYGSQDVCYSWDYDCNNSADQQFTTMGSATTCVANAGVCNTVSSGNAGWKTSVPACGVSTNVYINNPGTCASGPYPVCVPTDYDESTKQQLCK